MLKEIIDLLTVLLGSIATMSKDRRELQDSALRAISNALDETCLYYRDLDRGNPRNLDREALLVKYWSAAAIPLIHIDQNLAALCDYKSEYWINPTHYSEQEITNLGIDLNNIRQAYRKILKPTFQGFNRKMIKK